MSPVRAAPLLLCLACGPADEEIVTATFTADEVWWVELEEWPLPTGAVAVPLRLEEDELPATGLDVRVFAYLPSSEDSANGGICVEVKQGRYQCPLLFNLQGQWHIEGTVTDGITTDDFVLSVEVE